MSRISKIGKHVVIDLDKQTIECDGVVKHSFANENYLFSLLEYFCKNANITLSEDMIYLQVYKEENTLEDRRLKDLIYRLRKLLPKDKYPEFAESFQKKTGGYMYTGSGIINSNIADSSSKNDAPHLQDNTQEHDSDIEQRDLPLGADTRSDREVIADNLGKAFQPLIDAIETQKSQMLSPEQMGESLKVIGAAAEAQEHEMAEKIRENEKQERTQVTNNLFQEFRTDCDRILQDCIEMDPSGQPISISLPDDIAELLRKWKFDIRKVPDSDNRKLMQDILQTLSDYSYYLSDEFMRVLNEDGDRLIYRNESFEEGRRLTNELRPKTVELRSKMAELYKRLWPAPELDQPGSINDAAAKTGAVLHPDTEVDESKNNVVHQKVVNQYGDNPIHIDHVDNLNL